MKAKIKINSKNKYTSFITIVEEILKTVDKKTVQGWCVHCSLTELNGKLYNKILHKPINEIIIKLDAFQTFTIYIAIINNSLELGEHEKTVAYYIVETIEHQHHSEFSYYVNLIRTVNQFSNFDITLLE